MKKFKIFYCILFFALCLCPAVGMFFVKPEVSSENRKLAEFPKLQTEEGFNNQWLSQAGDYFQEHFAFRNELVTANALINGKLLGTSTAEGVIQGSEGWLYYKDSLSDYLGTDLMTDRSLYNVAHSLSMMQTYLNEKGVKLLFTTAPNKNSLYGENMPYYNSVKVTGEKNLKNLEKYLEREQVPYVNLYEAFRNREEVLYHKRDSHWNNRGAAFAGELLLDALGKEHVSYENQESEVRRDFVGDLDKMLYPLAVTEEDEIYYTAPEAFAYVEEVESNFDPRIHTVNPSAQGSLVMYRDSFGNALLPFMADAYGKAYFSRGIPYQLGDVDVNGADTVLVERAERFLPEMAQSPPVMPAPIILEEREREIVSGDGAADIKMTPQGPLTRIEGRILPEYIETETRIYMKLNGVITYEAFPMDIETKEGIDSGGFCLYVPSEVLAPGENTVELMCGTEENLFQIYCNTIEEENSNEK